MVSELWGSAEVHHLASDAVGDDFRVFVAPCGENPESTLVVTDGDGLFGLTVDVVRMMQIPALVPPLLVVGIGYPAAGSLLDTVEIRTRDLTPTPLPIVPLSGGGSNFATFLDRELHPFLRERFPRAAEDVTFFGHSLGGLFGTCLMLSGSTMFRRYILSSPSLWWDDHVAFRLEESRADRETDLATTAFFGIGSLETDEGRREESRNLPDDHPAKPPAAHLDMVDDLRRFVAQLRARNHPGLEVTCVEIADEFHATVPAIVLGRALRAFWSSNQIR